VAMNELGGISFRLVDFAQPLVLVLS
jgi:hypothetical protein